ncbi:hypothetical protein ASD90_06305 [Terrabacter sp. Root181]|nr:hypothetical protein ASD90_06305 [Terrabacter sp. Root181]
MKRVVPHRFSLFVLSPHAMRAAGGDNGVSSSGSELVEDLLLADPRDKFNAFLARDGSAIFLGKHKSTRSSRLALGDRARRSRHIVRVKGDYGLENGSADFAIMMGN